MPRFLLNGNRDATATDTTALIGTNSIKARRRAHDCSLDLYLYGMVRHKKDLKGKKYHSGPPRQRPLRHQDGDSTNPPPDFKAACWDLEHCDPKRCSGKRLMHFGLMRELSVGQKFAGVVIS